MLNFIYKSILTKILILLIITACVTGIGCSENNVNDPEDENAGKAAFWLTSPEDELLFSEQPGIQITDTGGKGDSIVVNPGLTFQEIDGFGFALTGGSAYHINNMSASARADLLTELFDYTGKDIGVSYLRVSIGASDLDFEVFSYDDLPPAEIDTAMQHFTLEKDREYLIPVLKEIIDIYPDIKILGSPWSAPVWMKTNGSSIGGSLKTEYHDAYAEYFVKYIQGMQNEGLSIDAITVQNEPLHPGNNPSMFMPANQQADFIKNHLGPAFEEADIQTKIIIYDHNADRIDYPLSILDDPEAAQYVDGSAFHLYGGQIGALSQVHNAHPDKHIYFTEQWIGAPGDMAGDLKWHMQNLIIGGTRNWCKTVLEWNLASDPNYDPHTDGGCDRCLGGITINGDMVTRNPGYYIVAHAAKFVRPGSNRIDSSLPEDLSNAAFKTPDGKIVVIVLNNSRLEKSFNIKLDDKYIQSSLPGGAAGTYIW